MKKRSNNIFQAKLDFISKAGLNISIMKKIYISASSINAVLDQTTIQSATDYNFFPGWLEADIFY
jgi:hypothetical protein